MLLNLRRDRDFLVELARAWYGLKEETHMKRCAHCGGPFGYGRRFCRTKCREAFLNELEAERARIKSWINFISQPAA
jgi:predicted nucleic acid-binding Zn ribbon protein